MTKIKRKCQECNKPIEPHRCTGCTKYCLECSLIVHKRQTLAAQKTYKEREKARKAKLGKRVRRDRRTYTKRTWSRTENDVHLQHVMDMNPEKFEQFCERALKRKTKLAGWR